MEIVDTAGQEEYSSFRDSSVATGDAFLVLFAINSVSSWHELKDLRSKIIQDRQLTSAIPMVLVGNKLVSFLVVGRLPHTCMGTELSSLPHKAVDSAVF